MSTPAGPLATATAITVRRAVASDWEKLAEFYQRYFPDRARLNDARLWQWQFVDHPGHDRALPFFILEADGQIEGAIGYVPLTLRAGNQVYAAVHPVNFFVNPKFTGLPALRLFRAATGIAPITLGSYVSGDARRLLLKSGFVDLGAHMQQYYMALRTDVTPSLRSRIITRARLAWKRLLGGYVHHRCPSLKYELTRQIDPARAQHAATWQRTECQLQKTAAEYAWRYAQSPVLECTFCWQLNTGTPVGFAVLHLDRTNRTAVLLDWNTDGVDLLRDVDLLYALVRFTREQQMDYLVSDAMSPSLHRALRWVGFGHRVSDLGFMVYGQDAEIRKNISDASRWHFMVGDTDRY